MDIDNKNSLWSTQQRQALTALGIPLWQSSQDERQQQKTHVGEPAEKLYCYKVEQWLLVTAEQLAVEPAKWLNDLVHLCMGSNLVSVAEVSRTALQDWPSERILTLPTRLPSATEKKALWEQIINAQR